MEEYKTEENETTQPTMILPPKKGYKKKEENEFDFEGFETNFIAATGSVDTPTPENINTLVSALENMFNNLNIYFELNQNLPEVLDFLNSKNYLSFIHHVVMTKIDPSINLNAMKIFALILRCNIPHPIFKNECFNEEFINDFFNLVANPSIISDSDDLLNPANISINSVFTSGSLNPSLYDPIRITGLIIILMVLQRNPELLQYVAFNQDLCEILTSFETPTIEDLSIVCNIFQIMIVSFPDNPDVDYFIDYIICNSVINYKIFPPAVDCILEILKTPIAPQFANEFALSNIGMSISSHFSVSDTEIKKKILKIISLVSKKSNPDISQRFISHFDIYQFFNNISDDVIICSMKLLKSIIVHHEDIDMRFVNVSLNILFKYLNDSTFILKATAISQISRILCILQENVIEEIVKKYQLIDLIADSIEDDQKESIVGSIMIANRLLKMNNPELRSACENAFFTDDILDVVEPCQDSDNPVLLEASLDFIAMFEERTKEE